MQDNINVVSPTEKKRNRVFKVCLTGGPCSGKTSSLTHIIDRLSPGVIIYTVPEMFTMTTQAGYVFNPQEMTIYELAQLNVYTLLVIIMFRKLLSKYRWIMKTIWKKLLHSKKRT